MMKINMNKLAKAIAEEEGLKDQLNIAQIKEVMRIMLAKLADEWHGNNEAGVVDLISKY